MIAENPLMQCLQSVSIFRNDRLGVLDVHVHRLSVSLPPLLRRHTHQRSDDHTGPNHNNHTEYIDYTDYTDRTNQQIILIILIIPTYC